jgi:hypothetical protein
MTVWRALHLPLLPLILAYRVLRHLNPARTRCPQQVSCSERAKRDVKLLGSAAALPVIVAYMSLCVCEKKPPPRLTRPTGH